MITFIHAKERYDNYINIRLRVNMTISVYFLKHYFVLYIDIRPILLCNELHPHLLALGGARVLSVIRSEPLRKCSDVFLTYQVSR
jgi:hypothetical protein